VDALITWQPDLPLVIRCADCAPVFIVDRTTPAIALIHSGKKGTLANVVGATLQKMTGDCLAVIGPSIGPCHYEMDIWAGIEQQLREAGVRDIHNPRICTACRLDRYFSYRAEKGQTGRMFAVLALNAPPTTIPAP
jgi:copper oxidase (laccase) domain-containing protein